MVELRNRMARRKNGICACADTKQDRRSGNRQFALRRQTHQRGLHQMLQINLLPTAGPQRKEEKAYQLLYNRKFAEESENWLREMRDTAYIEVLSE